MSITDPTLKSPLWRGVVQALFIAGILASLTIGLLTNSELLTDTVGSIIGFCYFITYLLLSRRQPYQPQTDDVIERRQFLTCYTIGMAVLLLLVGITYLVNGPPDRFTSISNGYYWIITITFFLGAIGSVYQAIRKRCIERRSNIGLAIATLWWVVFYVVYNFAASGTTKTGAEVGLFVAMLLGVIITASATFMKAEDTTPQLDRPKATPFYAEQEKADKVKQQR